MTEVLTRSGMAAQANARLKNRMNAGIVWGTNNVPANCPASWFAGPNTGIDYTAPASLFKSGEPDAAHTISVLKTMADRWGGIRRVRCVYVYSGVGTYDRGTQIANVHNRIAFASAVNMSELAVWTDMNFALFTGAIDKLYNAYVAACRNTTLTLTHTVCHSSCHNNCHAARGRR